MIKPEVEGEVICIEDQPAEFVDRSTGQKRSYRRRAVELLCSKPSRGTLRIGVIGDGVLTLKEGEQVHVGLSSFSVESNVPVAKALAEAFSKIKP